MNELGLPPFKGRPLLSGNLPIPNQPNVPVLTLPLRKV
jgi:hypothetical protein